MPLDYAKAHPHVRHQLLDRVAAGEPLTHVCAEPGTPTHTTVRAWSRADPDFAAALAQARLRGDRSLAFDEAKAAALLARLAAGEGIVSILRDPAMPSRRVYARWRATQAPFQETVWRLNKAKAAARIERDRARRRDFDPVLADRIVARVATGAGYAAMLNSRQGLPCRSVVDRWRKTQPEFDRALGIALRLSARAARRRPRDRTPDYMVEAICEGIAEGQTFESLGGLPDMPCARTLFNWMRTRPDFAEAVERAKRARKAAAEIARMAARVATLR